MPEIEITEPLNDELPSIMDLIDELNTLAVKSVKHTDKKERQSACKDIFNLTCKITAEFQNMCREEAISKLSDSAKLLKNLPNNKENVEKIRQIKMQNLKSE